MITDYESWGRVDYQSHKPALLEVYSGTSIVQWQGRIEANLVSMVDAAEKGHNQPYADKLRQYLQLWRANEIGGSINREPIEVLKAAADMLAVDNWKFGNYFMALSTSLKTLLASEEELPRGAEDNDNDPFAGGTGGRGAPPMSPQFGPEGDEPPGSETDDLSPESSDLSPDGENPDDLDSGGPSGPSEDDLDTGELI